MTIAVAYCPPKLAHPIYEFFPLLGHNFVVEGDLHAKHQQWSCHSNKPKGTSLLTSVTSNKYIILSPSGPTY